VGGKKTKDGGRKQKTEISFNKGEEAQSHSLDKGRSNPWPATPLPITKHPGGGIPQGTSGVDER